MRYLVWSVLALSLAATPATAQDPALPSDPPSTEIGGLLDLYYDYYTTQPSGDAVLRNFDVKHNQFAMSMAQVWLQRPVTEESRVGFRFKLNFGPASSNYIHCCEPGGTPYENIQEAFVSYLAPAGNGLQIDAGVFVTPIGAEVIEAKDNMNYSRGLLFALAIPYYHSGVRLSYAASDKITLMGSLVNGWNSIEDVNTGKTLHGGVVVRPVPDVSVVANYMFGPEQPGTNDDFRHLIDAIVSVTAMPRLTLAANYDYGTESVGGSDVSWQGLAAYAKYQLTPLVAVSPRFEFLRDPDGFTTGVSQTLKEVTGTLDVRVSDNLQWRAEYRTDFSDQPVFPDVGSDGIEEFQKSRTSLGFALLYSFAGSIR